jgi:hypothetical protein
MKDVDKVPAACSLTTGELRDRGSDEFYALDLDPRQRVPPHYLTTG